VTPSPSRGYPRIDPENQRVRHRPPVEHQLPKRQRNVEGPALPRRAFFFCLRGFRVLRVFRPLRTLIWTLGRHRVRHVSQGKRALVRRRDRRSWKHGRYPVVRSSRASLREAFDSACALAAREVGSRRATTRAVRGRAELVGRPVSRTSLAATLAGRSHRVAGRK
jgi:hypothetical protein